MEREQRIQSQKETIKELWDAYVKRPGAKELMEWLGETDFFVAPASARHHSNYPGGLARHSLNVYERLVMNVVFKYPKLYGTETVVIAALLHDVCKIDTYELVDMGEELEYRHKNSFPAGHGEKSVMLIQRYMQLTNEEIAAINWHMGAWDPRAKTGELNQAWEKYPLAFLLHIADMQATHLDERRDNEQEQHRYAQITAGRL